MDISEDDLNISQDLSRGSSPEEGGRGCRNKKRHSDPTCCPVCSVTVRETELALHLSSEIDKLNKIANNTRPRANGGRSATSSMTNGQSSGAGGSDKHWETYQKVRTNRQGRQRVKSRKRKAEEILCPICNKEVPDDITLHVELCLRRTEGRNDSETEEQIDVEAYEEYEWAGQSRIRVTSMLSGGLTILGSSLSMTEEDEDLNVDGDDAQIYGASQYTENDVVLPCSDPEELALRKAVIGSEPKTNGVTVSDIEKCGVGGDPVVSVLKARIRELESKETNKEVYKCLICMDRYRTPVISVCCWHVHCEQCWLQTLGAKKLCPQCNMITSPSDLRKIYM